jgi:hypothetical protein
MVVEKTDIQAAINEIEKARNYAADYVGGAADPVVRILDQALAILKGV